MSLDGDKHVDTACFENGPKDLHCYLAKFFPNANICRAYTNDYVSVSHGWDKGCRALHFTNPKKAVFPKVSAFL